MYTHIHIHMHVHIKMLVHTYINACTHIHGHMSIYININMHTHICVQGWWLWGGVPVTTVASTVTICRRQEDTSVHPD